MKAVQIMHEEHIGAIAIVEGNSLVGIFSERDLMNRVVLQKREPEKVVVSEVMSSPVETIRRDATSDDAYKTMLEKRIRHLPVVGPEGELCGMLSVRNLLHEKVSDLTDQLDSLEAYFTADGAGG
jgi:CBS domain-containing protein